MQPNIVETFRQHLPKNSYLSQRHPDVLQNKLIALKSLAEELQAPDTGVSNTQMVEAAVGCIIRIMECSIARDIDKRIPCERYTEIVTMRAADVSADSLRHMFDAIERKSTQGNQDEWNILQSNLQDVLRDVCPSVDHRAAVAHATDPRRGRILAFIQRSFTSDISELAI